MELRRSDPRHHGEQRLGHPVQAGGIIDACGNDGHVRSTNSGVTWTQTAGAIPTGRCSIAASPDENDVLFIYASDNNVYESDDAGGNWYEPRQPAAAGPDPVRRDQPARRHRRAHEQVRPLGRRRGAVQRRLHDPCRHDEHDDPALPDLGPPPRGPTAQVGAHADGGDLLFDTEDADGIDACPVLYSSDGGVHTNTVAGNPGCQTRPGRARTPATTASGCGRWTAPIAQARATEDLFFGTQDNGAFVTPNAGANPPTWSNPDCCDTFDVLTTPTLSLATVCCFPSPDPRPTTCSGPARAYTGAPDPQLPVRPRRSPSFTGAIASPTTGPTTTTSPLLMSDGIYLTVDIMASPIVWTPAARSSRHRQRVQHRDLDAGRDPGVLRAGRRSAPAAATIGSIAMRAPATRARGIASTTTARCRAGSASSPSIPTTTTASTSRIPPGPASG